MRPTVVPVPKVASPQPETIIEVDLDEPVVQPSQFKGPLLLPDESVTEDEPTQEDVIPDLPGQPEQPDGADQQGGFGEEEDDLVQSSQRL